MASAISTENLARASATHPRRVIVLWLIGFVVAIGLAGPLFGDAVTTEFNFIGNPESKRAASLLEDRLRGKEAITDVVIVRSNDVTVDNPTFRQTVLGLVGEINALGPEIVTGAVSYYQTNDESMVSADRRTTFIPVVLTGRLADAEANVVEVHEVMDDTDLPQGFDLSIAGQATFSRDFTVGAQEDLERGEAFGIPIALVILTVVFGAVAAAVVPIILAIIAIVMAIGIVSVIGLGFELNLFVQNIITMIGLAVGIDYSLFIVSRYREERCHGLEKVDAIAKAGATASRAVFFSGLTVVFALLGLLIIPHTVFISLGLGAISVVTVAVLAGLTLLPAVLSVMGDKVDRFKIRIPGLHKKCEGAKCLEECNDESHFSYWDRFARTVMRFPVVGLIVGVGLLVAASISYIDINTGSSGVSTFPDDFRAKQGFEVLQGEFGFGLDAPAEIVIDAKDVRSAPIQAAIQRLTGILKGDDRFGPATLEVNDDGDLALLAVPLVGDPTSKATADAVERLRERYIPAAFSGAPGAEVLVGGQTAEDNDFNDLALTYQPIVIALVLSLSFVLLTVVFRSIVIAAASIIMNLLSVGAAYGLLVLVFQKGYGNEVFGFAQTEVIQAWMPLMLFTILFGLSMDYQVFLLSRIREQYDKTGDNSESVVYGVTSTAGLITGAALIMVAVFGGFAAGKLEPLQQFGFGLAVAVLVDATLVRTVLVPATMKLLADRNWYLPPFLKWLPDFRVDGGSATEPTAADDD